MSIQNRILKRLIRKEIADIHTVLPGKIESYDAEEMRAKVKLLNKLDPLHRRSQDHDLKEVPQLIDVPVNCLHAGGFVIRPPYEEGDMVAVAFSERALDNVIITGDVEDTGKKRWHSLDDAMIMAGMRADQDQEFNSDHAVDLLIENMEEDTRWVLKEDGTTLLQKDEYELELTDDGELNITCDKDVNIQTEGDANIDAAGNVNLQGGDEPIARKGDAIEVEVTSGSSEGVYTGEIIEGSGEAHSG